MTRARELFQQAAASAKPPLKRLYFDTEPLTSGVWPFLSERFGYMLHLAQSMGIELCIPSPALFERSEQWIREALEEMAAIDGKVKGFRKTIAAIALRPEFVAPTPDQIREGYKRAAESTMSRFKVVETPFADCRTEDLHRMAVTRGFTFEQTSRGVVGLQDCVILLSVFDHLRSAPTQSGFVSRDAVFSRIPKIKPGDLDLRHVSGLDELYQILDDAHSAAYSGEYRQWWDRESAAIIQALERDRERIRLFVKASVDSGEFEKLFDGMVLHLEEPSVQGFGDILPELEGTSDDPVRFSCDVKIKCTALVEWQNLFGLGSSVWEQSPPMRSYQERGAVVELSARVSADYGHLELLSARLRR